MLPPPARLFDVRAGLAAFNRDADERTDDGALAALVEVPRPCPPAASAIATTSSAGFMKPSLRLHEAVIKAS